MNGYTRLVSCEYFTVDRFAPSYAEGTPLLHADELQILVALKSGCAVLSDEGVAYPLPFGQAVVLPAGRRKYTLLSEEKAAEVIRILQPRTS